MRRTLALLVFATLVASVPGAVSVEVYTLKDGRKLLGHYDDDTGQLYTLLANRECALHVERGDIVDRVPFRPKIGAVVPEQEAATSPKPMSPEERVEAERKFAEGKKDRDADALDAAGSKATRDAAAARRDAKAKRDEARRDIEKFRERASLEGVSAGEPECFEKLIVLPRTAGNNRATIDAWATAKKRDAEAAELDALAESKHREADALRSGNQTAGRD